MTEPLLWVPFTQAIRNLFPDAPLTEKNHLVIPHGLAETTILRRLGIAAPAPMRTQYTCTGSRTPFEVQLTTNDMLSTNRRAYVLSSMGVGKTACPLWTFDFLRRTGQVKRMIIDAPLSTLDFVWRAEMINISSPYRAVVLHGDRKKRLKLLGQDFDIYIINHDGIEVVYKELLLRPDIDVLCIDELGNFRNNNPRTRLLQRYAKKVPWVWGMTGSPTPRYPTDAWNQANVVTPDGPQPKYFKQFRDATMFKVNDFTWKPKVDAADKAYAIMQPSVRFTLEDVGELPPYITRIIDVPMGVKQKQIYDEIRKDAIAILQGNVISAANQGVLLNKLMQISLGYVYHDKGVAVLDNQARIRAILDMLESTDDPVILLPTFKHAIHAFAEAIKAAGHTVAVVTGDTLAKDRSIIFDDFQNHNKYKVLDCHPGVMAHGLTLTRAATVIWPGPTTSLDQYDQANARIRRVGQDKKQQFLHLAGTPVERKMYRRLIDAQNVQNKLLELFEDDVIPT